MPYETCGNARPNNGKLAVSIYTCPYHKNDGTIESPDICLKCKSFSDVGTLTHFSCMPFQVSIYLNRLCDLTLPKARKLFKIIRNSVDDNERSIAFLERYLTSRATFPIEDNPKDAMKWRKLKFAWDESGIPAKKKRRTHG